ncbi:MAG: glycosyltransferase family 4 protein, partial [Nitrososphaera sp.]
AVTVFTNDDATDGDSNPCLNFKVLRRGRYSPSRIGWIKRSFLLRSILLDISPDILLVGDARAQRVFFHLMHLAVIPYCTVFYGTDLELLRAKLCYQGYSPRGLVSRHLLREYIKSACERICISRFTANAMRQLYGEELSCLILYPCVSELFLTRPLCRMMGTEFDNKSARAAISAKVRLITVGRISERKNQLGVLAILAELQRRHGLDFHYYIVGNVDSAEHLEYLRRLNRFIAANRLENSVSILSRTTDEEKISYIDASDIFIMLSRTVGNSIEGFGISAIEASSRAKPIIVSEQGGMPETVLQGKSGFTVPVDNTRAVADAIMRLVHDGDLRRAMGAAGREYVLANFTAKTMARRLDDHLRQSMSDRK